MTLRQNAEEKVRGKGLKVVWGDEKSNQQNPSDYLNKESEGTETDPIPPTVHDLDQIPHDEYGRKENE